MKPSKFIMNPMRVELLKIINNKGEMNSIRLGNLTSYKLSAVNLAVTRFGEYGLIKYTGGGFFEISEKGKEYLKSEIELVNYRPMPETECGYCKICGEKTLYECDVKNGEKKFPICEECAEERGLVK